MSRCFYLVRYLGKFVLQLLQRLKFWNQLKNNFADLLCPLYSCSLETASPLHFFLRCKITLHLQNYTTLCRALMTDLKINDAIMSLNESYLLHIMLHGRKNFDNDMNISILTAAIKFIKDTESFDQPLF